MRAAAEGDAAEMVPGPLERALDATRDLGDRLLASPDFRRRAAAFPPTRGVARRRARAVFDLCAGFVYSQILAAAVSLGLFELLAERPQTPADLARRLPLDEAATARLLGATTALGLTRKRRGGCYGLGPLGAPLVGNDGLKAVIAHHAMLYEDLRDPIALLQGQVETRLKRYWTYAGTETAGGDSGPYSALMGASQAMIAEEVVAAYPLRRHRRIIDLGGGDGTFLSAVAQAAPESERILVDLPQVVARASGPFAAIAADIRRDSLPTGADLVTLVRVLHDHEDQDASAILAKARGALAPGGTLLIAEPMAETPGAESVGAYFAFYLLAMGQGRPRSRDELRALLAEAGFGSVRTPRNRNPVLVSLMTARS